MRAIGFREALALAVHVPLAFAMSHSPNFAIAHSVAAFVVGLLFACVGPLHRVAYVAAYITGAEVLWRMTDGAVFYEFSKYAVMVLFGLAIIVRHMRLRAVPLTCALLLLPSVLFTLRNASLSYARQAISFNLSGPVSLAVCAIFFSSVKLQGRELMRMLVCLICPIVAIATVTLYATVTAQELAFTGESNFVTSGGYGPNQVSSALGLGAFIALLMSVNQRISQSARLLCVAAALVFATQSAMTFSRNGVMMAGLSFAAACFFLMRSPKSRSAVIGVTGVLAAVAVCLIVPRMNDFTHGALERRYLQTNMTNRESLMYADLAIFAKNPVFGVGPGMGFSLRADYIGHSNAHTEYTRMLAEHGLLGLAALALLLFMLAKALLRTRGVQQRAFVAGLVSWVGLYLLVNAMRMTAPSFLFGLASVKSWAEPDNDLG